MNQVKKPQNRHIRHVFIIGCKGIPAQYGGFETFVDKLTQYQQDRCIRYHVACAAEPEDYHRENARFYCHHAECVAFPWRRLGPARAVTYDLDALWFFMRYEEDPAPGFLCSGLPDWSGGAGGSQAHRCDGRAAVCKPGRA